jgi:hypothetical protein
MKHIDVSLFSVSIKEFLPVANMLKDKDDYIKTKQIVGEKLFYEFFIEKNKLTYKCEDRETIESSNKINVISSKKGFVDEGFFLYLVSEEATGRYYISSRNLSHDKIGIHIAINDNKYIFFPKILGEPSLVDITSYIKNGDDVIVEIPHLGFSSIYNSKKEEVGKCEIRDQSIVSKIEDLLIVGN